MSRRLRKIFIYTLIMLQTSNLFVKGGTVNSCDNVENNQLAMLKDDKNHEEDDFKDSLQYGRRKIPISQLEEEECELWNKVELVEDVDCKKEWTIKFNEELNDTYYVNDIIFIKNQYNRCFETYIRIKDKKTFVIVPREPYEEGVTYTLYIKKNVTSKSGEKLKKGIKMPFKIKCDECKQRN